MEKRELTSEEKYELASDITDFATAEFAKRLFDKLEISAAFPRLDGKHYDVVFGPVVLTESECGYLETLIRDRKQQK